uniref:HELP domain-containing protein n=1 Tax=Globisporangium ultimum (strain ATCC 200006 / CBS 805.95 / DAOM BR144) TaxID=431595 RepID=K3XBQ4_GLOUD
MTSWVDYFDCPDEHVEENDQDDSDLDLEHAILPMDDADFARKRDLSFPVDLKAPSFTQDAPVPLKPWQNVVANAAPSAPPTINPSLPAASLDLDWVYGFNSDFRNVAKYISPAEIVYPASSVVVVYDVIEHKQRFVLHHSDLVQTLAVHPTNKNIIASGERGLVPKIVVWNTQTLGSTLSVLRGFHKHGVRHLAWMPNGRTLVSIGQDDFHCVAVYQWEKSTSIEWTKPAVLIFADRCGYEAVHACIVTTNNHFVTCGQRHLFFWSRENEDRYSSDFSVFYKRRGVFGRKAKVQTLLSAAPLPNDPNVVVVGTARGQILLFEGRNCIKVIHAHASAVNVLQSFPGGILSAGKDGKIRLWSKRMEPGAQFDIEALGSISSRVRSLSASPDGGAKLLIATSGAEIYEIATSDGSNLHFGAMLCGHFAYELRGLAVNPLKREFCTTGDDRTVRVWDMNSHHQLRMTTLDAPSQTCAYSPDGSLLAIGQGADDTDLSSTKQKKRINANKQGAFAVLSENGLAVKYEAKDSKKYIRTVKFAGDGQTLAVGSSDNFIYAYNTEDWASKGKCKARDASAVLSHFDFSSTGEYIMASATNKGEMVFFETASGVEITRIATLKDVEWLSWTCPYGWWVQGAWPSVQSADYEISAIDRSASSQENARVSGQLLVVGDNFGSLRLYRYPCVAMNSLSQVCQGASSAISAVRFSTDNSMVIACAKEERCIFQWRLEYEEEDTVGVDGTGSTQAEYEYHPTSDDEQEMSHGNERSAFDEAAAVGDFALELLYQQGIADTKTDCNAALVAASSPPVKPWVSSSIAPSDAPDETDLELSAVPNENLELEWVYGYRCHDMRNNLFLTKSKAYLVYPAANVVVIQDNKLWLQRYFKQHTDEVTSIATHFGFKNKKTPSSTSSPRSDAPNATKVSSKDEPAATSTANTLEIVASGQMGKYPTIHVWRIDTLDVLMSLRGFHRRGIAEMRFNSAGNLLASVGLDDQNSLAVYDWQSGLLLARASTNSTGRILGVCFQQESLTAHKDSGSTAAASTSDGNGTAALVTVGVKMLSFWRLSGKTLVKKNAILGKKGLLQSFLSVVFCGKDAIVGTTSGDLYRFKGIELVSIVPAHSRSVAALYCVSKAPYHIASGGKDGVVKLWSSDLECLAEFGEFDSRKHAIRSVFWDFDRNILLVGTLGSSIHQISSLDGSIVTPRTPDGTDVLSVENHFRKELHGLSICPSKDRFCTTGDDGTLRIWDLLRHIQVLAKELDTSSRACAYSYDGDFVAVGLGSGDTGKRHKKDGSLLVFEERTLSVELVYETRDTKQSISVIKYSPDGQSLVVGSLDNSIYIYDVPSNYTKRAVFNKHKSFITHLDISTDSQYIRSNCGGFELLFADITTGSHVASATALRNQKWETCATVFNWSNQGIWPATAAAAAIEITSSSASLPGASPEINEAVLVAGTSHGTLNLFKFPCFMRGAGYKTYFGHSGGIALVEFSGARNGGDQCISIGKSDRCIFQWRKTRAKIHEDASGGGGNASTVKDPEEDVDITAEGLFLPESFINIVQEEIKPYLSAIIPPSTGIKEPSEQDGAAGKCAFTLEQVFGFRTYDVRNNVVYSKTKHVIYHTGCIGVHYDRRTHAQKFYQNHSRSIVSLAASRDGSYVATGEICSENLQQEHPRVHIWEPTSCTNVTILSECHTKAVSYLAFSSNGKLLASIGQDEHHSLAVYASSSGHWFDGALLATTKTTRHDVLFVTFVDDSSSSSYHIVSGGNHHVLFWRLDPPNLVGTFGVFGARAQSQPVLCGASLGAAVVTGCSTGHIYVWESCTVSKAVPAHNGAVYALHTAKEGYVSGGRDGHVKLWSQTMAPLADFNVNDVKPASQNAIIRSVFWDTAEDRVLIGTKGGEILELSRLTKETSLVTESHYDRNGLYGLSAHPQRPELIATVGEDQTVRVWDLNRRQVVAKVTLDGSLQCVSFSPDGKWLAVGFGSAEHTGGASKSGAFVILDAQTLEVVHEGRDSKQSVADIKFSPDLTLLALGSIDHCVYFYSTLDNFSLRFKFPKAKGRITHMDFAADSSALRVNSEAWELLYVSTLDGSQVTTPSSMKDVAWATESCVFSWSAQGIWDFARPDEYFHILTKAHTQELLVSGNNKGEIRVYNAPCLSKRTEQHVLRGHGMNVSNVVFTCDDSRLVTIGANDKSVFVWRVC